MQHDPSLDRRTLMMAIAPFADPSLGRSLWQFGSTLAAYLAIIGAMYALADVSTWLVLALAVPAAGMTVRLFIVQHDCGHGSFFRSPRLNTLLGRACAPFTFTPYAFWRRQHANHHASFNNLDRRGTGLDVYSNCSTLAEYEALSRNHRVLYRVARHPIITQLILPPIVFLLVYRFPFDTPADATKQRNSVLLTNLALACVLGGLIAIFGFGTVALIQLPIISIAAVVGVWLFSVQHRFEESLWTRQDKWSATAASLHGSSYLKLPRVLQWFTGNIGFHHIHHLSSRVPNYRLADCHSSQPELGGVTTLGLWDALLAPCFALWDEQNERMVRFPR